MRAHGPKRLVAPSHAQAHTQWTWLPVWIEYFFSLLIPMSLGTDLHCVLTAHKRKWHLSPFVPPSHDRPWGWTTRVTCWVRRWRWVQYGLWRMRASIVFLVPPWVIPVERIRRKVAARAILSSSASTQAHAPPGVHRLVKQWGYYVGL